MGNIISNNEPISTIKELYKLNSIELLEFQESIENNIPLVINKDDYMLYNSYMNSLLSIQNKLSNSIPNDNLININSFLMNVRHKYESSYKTYEYQKNRRNEYDNGLTHFNCTRIDSLNIFKLNNKFTMNELKLSYRNLARKYHLPVETLEGPQQERFQQELTRKERLFRILALAKFLNLLRNFRPTTSFYYIIQYEIIFK